MVPPSASWWSYLGLASTTPLPISPIVSPTATAPEHDDVSRIMPLDGQRDSYSSSNHNAPTPIQVDPVQTTSSQQPNLPLPPSILSADTSATNASWFTSLVGWKTKPPISPAPTGSESNPSELTQSQRIKEEALAREMVPLEPSIPPTSDINPIINSSTRASWVSFFSARSRATIKPLTNGEGEMEVMDIDDAGTMPTPTSPSGAAHTQSLSPSVYTTSPVKQNGLPPPATPPLPPLTDSKQIKMKASEVRKVSTTSKKDLPRLPNLVLPSWGDTFYTPPRIDPPPPTGALNKTIRVVSRLWALPPVDPEIEEYRKERAIRYSDESTRADQGRQPAVRSVGRNLPRVWSVLDGTPAGHSLADVKRVVVIGVHGYE